MSHAAVRMHEHGNFGSTYTSALTMGNPLMNNRRNQLSDWPSLDRQEKEGTAKRTAGSHLLVMPERLPLTIHTTIHTQIKYHFAGQSLTKAKLMKETVQMCYVKHTT